MKIIGHRGAKGLAPENTVASLLKAISHQVDEVECDVRLSRDGVPVLVHGSRLAGQNGRLLQVSRTNFADLKAHKSDLATLSEAIQTVNRKVPLVIEVKPGQATEPVVSAIQQFMASGWQAADFVLASFDYQVLKQLKTALPGISLVVNETWSGLRGTRRARRLGAQRLAMHAPWLWSGFVRAVSRSYQLYAFTVNDPARARQLARYGLAGVYTDFPDLFEK